MTDKASLSSKTLGTVDLSFTGCTTEAGKVKCQTGEVKGQISVKGEWHLVDLEAASKLLLGLMILMPQFTLTCGVLKVEIKGAVIGESTEYKEVGTEAFKALPMPAAGTAELVLGTVIKDTFSESAGVQAVKVCKLPTTLCEGKVFHLEINFGVGFEEAGLGLVEEAESEAGSKIHIDY